MRTNFNGMALSNNYTNEIQRGGYSNLTHTNNINNHIIDKHNNLKNENIQNNNDINLNKKETNNQTKKEVEELKELTKKLNEEMEKLNPEIEFSYNDKIDNFVVKVIDKNTDKVIRKIPSDEAIKIMEKMKELRGTLLDKKG